jgi:M-phase inducer tyrosine phosphatase
MEASSPLAAMQAPSFMPAWGRNDMYTSHPHAHLSTGNTFGPGAFDFRDLSMKRSNKPDYFQMKPVRGSSPTASLAADLSQNFHIDMRFAGCNSMTNSFADLASPQLPTPRRSLFTSNLFGTIDGRGKDGTLEDGRQGINNIQNPLRHLLPHHHHQGH